MSGSRSSRNKLTKMAKKGSNMDKKDVNTHTHVKSHSFPMHGDVQVLYDIIRVCNVFIYSHSYIVIHIFIHNIFIMGKPMP